MQVYKQSTWHGHVLSCEDHHKSGHSLLHLSWLHVSSQKLCFCAVCPQETCRLKSCGRHLVHVCVMSVNEVRVRHVKLRRDDPLYAGGHPV